MSKDKIHKFNELVNSGNTPTLIKKAMSLDDSQYQILYEEWQEWLKIVREARDIKIEENQTELKNIWWRINEVAKLLLSDPRNEEYKEEFENLKIKYSQKTIYDGIIETNESSSNQSLS